MTHLEFIMSEQIRLQKEARQLAKEATLLEQFFKAGKYKRLINVEMELLRNQELMDAILKLCYTSNPYLMLAFSELITPRTTHP